MRLWLLTLLTTLLAAAPAHAAMEIAMQDDFALVNGYSNGALALKQFKAMGGTSVRINYEHRRRNRDDESISAKTTRYTYKAYDHAIDAVIAAGLKPQLTLVWRGVTDPIRIGGWMHNVAARYGTKVNRYSILNEPDLYLRTHGVCNKSGLRAFHRANPRSTFYLRGQWRASDPTFPHGFDMHIACLRQARGRLYRPIVNWAAQSIRDANPHAQILAGETSGSVGLGWFVKAAQPQKMHVTGWAHHPFQFKSLTPGRAASNWGIGRLKQIRALVHMPLYLTEFGYPHPHSSMDQHVYHRRLSRAEVTKAIVGAWKVARRAHVREMLQYQWFVKPTWRHDYWETALLDKDDGKLTPQYRALRALIRSWHR